MIPFELTQIPHWITWQPGTKAPTNSRGQRASALDEKNWQDFIAVNIGWNPTCCDMKMKHDPTFMEHHLMNNMFHIICSKCRTGRHIPRKNLNIGFVLTNDYVVIDADHQPYIDLVTDRFTDTTYTEVSPNGGLHVWLRGSHANKRGSFEVYGSKRYMTVTGNGNDLPIRDLTIVDVAWITAQTRPNPTIGITQNKPSLKSK
jgi:primase-polymerase (primpol)-like protein